MAPALGPEDFPTFFEAVHHAAPFRWQERAATELVEGEPWPTLEAPTGAGKTSLIDCVIFALACQAGERRRTIPLRTFWVVDRRAVVDQVYEHAEALRRAIKTGDGILESVRTRLESLDGLGGLAVERWRGGIEERPERLRLTGPAVICSTIDQVGSRLLFRGYGTSRLARPLDAALAGNDSLIVIDEAHIAQPFLQTLEGVRTLAAPLDTSSPTKPVRSTVLSATLPADAEPGFRLREEERLDERIASRLAAEKRLRLVKKKTRRSGLADEALRLAQVIRGIDGVAPVIGVIANTVGEARDVHRQITEAGANALLLIGPCRPYERDKLIARIPHRSDRYKLEAAEIVVATQTIEVGVDLDFDALVTVAAPLSALIQRLGRLDREGRLFEHSRQPSEAVIMASSEKCPVYGDVARETWRWLSDSAEGDSLTVNAADLADLRLKGPAEPESLAPILGPWHLEALCQTSIDPVPSPDIGPFLHGDDALDVADVRVLWRADLDAEMFDQWRLLGTLSPPRAHEVISLPVGRVRTWLQRRQADADALDFGDVESVDDEPVSGGGGGRRVLRWDRKAPKVIGPAEIKPGDTLLVPSVYGGADEFGWNPRSANGDRSVCDVRDLAPMTDRLRVHSRLVPQLTHAVTEPLLALEAGEVDTREAYTQALASLRASLAEDDRELATAVRGLPEFGELFRYPTGGGAILLGKSAGSRKSKPVRVSYEDHVDAVVKRVGQTTDALPLQDSLREALVQAARVHDAGKLDPRFQAYLNGGVAPPEGVVLAKSGRMPRTPLDRRAREEAGWPGGMRHELWSAALADLLGEQEGWEELDLITYLISTHHGNHRPFYGRDTDDEPIEVAYDGGSLRLPSNARLQWAEHAHRFSALNRRFGPWGLAALEAILVLSDRAVSAEEQSK